METLKRLPFKARKSVFEKLEKIVDIASLSKEEREKYDESIKVYRDSLVTMAFAEEKGKKEGIEIGIEIGKEEGHVEERLEIARNMKSIGMNVDAIQQVTKLTLEEIEKL